MATPTFDATEIPSLAYDFTALQRQDGTGPCTGKGTIPEPTARQLARFDIAGRDVLDYRPSPFAPEGQAEAVERSRLLTAIAEIAGEEGPTRSELEELEPRALRSLFRWLLGVLKSPTEVGA